MAEAMLHPVRHGQNVVTIYYGHPGIFVYASHRAIQIAHKQGLKAKMLPGVSALDCLFADLGIDPSYPGLQVLESTDFLVRNRKILTDGHLVLLQVSRCKNIPCCFPLLFEFACKIRMTDMFKHAANPIIKVPKVEIFVRKMSLYLKPTTNKKFIFLNV